MKASFLNLCVCVFFIVKESLLARGPVFNEDTKHRSAHSVAGSGRSNRGQAVYTMKREREKEGVCYYAVSYIFLHDLNLRAPTMLLRGRHYLLCTGSNRDLKSSSV